MSEAKDHSAAASGRPDLSQAVSDTLVSLEKNLTNSTSAFAFGGSIPADVLKAEDVCLLYQGSGSARLVKLPLSTTDAAALYDSAHFSSHGVGDQTVYDPTYRQAKEITVPNFALSPDPALHAALLGAVKTTLAHGRDLKAELYKLNIYEGGGFFKAHRDHTSAPSSSRSLLPTPAENSSFDTKGHTETFDWSSDVGSNTFHWASLYSDCEHEVLPVKSGHRVTVQYNILDVPTQGDDSLSVLDSRLGWLTSALTSLAEGSNKTLKVAFPLEHEYPFARPKSHKYGYREKARQPLEDRLKGSDKILLAAVESLGLEWHFRAVYEHSDEQWKDEGKDLIRRFETFKKDCARFKEEEEKAAGKQDTESRIFVSGRNHWRKALAEEKELLALEKPVLLPNQTWSTPFRHRLRTSHNFGLLENANIYERPLWEYLANKGARVDADILWVTPPTDYAEKTSYLVYGNEACAEAMYSAVALLVLVPPRKQDGEGQVVS